MHASEQLQLAFNLISSKSWKEGFVPNGWKHADVKFLKKSGKANYHSALAYRPISLASVIGKGLERIVAKRLYAFSEHKTIIDRGLGGFQEI